MSDSIRKHVRTAVLGLAVLTLALAPAAHAAQPVDGDAGMLAAAWSRLADFGEWLAASVGLSSSSEEPAPVQPIGELFPDAGNAQCSGECTEDDSGPTMDPDG